MTEKTREYRKKSKYQGNGNPIFGVGNPKSLYLDRIAGMDDEKLFSEVKDKIWASAYAVSNPKSDYHWMADACYDECVHRGKGAMYQRAWKEVQETATKIKNEVDRRGWK